MGDFMIYLDNAATGGFKPPSVIAAEINALKNYSVNAGRGGYRRSLAASQKVYETRQKLADFFGAEGSEQVAFTANCTHSINCILKGLLAGGGHIVISDLEHNAVMRPLHALCKNCGVQYSTVETSGSDEEIAGRFAEKIRSNTKLIFSTHASNVTGKIMPVELIGSVAKSRGIPFAVDAAQTAGVIEINMAKMNIDYLAVAPHKGLFAPMGIGVLICRKPLLYTVIEGGTGSFSSDFSQPDEMPEKIESGTVNLPAIFALNAAMDFVKARGTDNIYRHELALIKRAYLGLKAMESALLYTDLPIYKKNVPVLSFNVKNRHCDDVAGHLADANIAVRSGLHCAPTAHKTLGTEDIGTVRVSTGIFNNEAQIDCFLSVIKKI